MTARGQTERVPGRMIETVYVYFDLLTMPTPRRNKKHNANLVILVVDDVEEVRDGVAALLQSDGYKVEAVRSEAGAIASALRKPPNLILINLAGSPRQVIEAGRRINREAHLQDCVPIVLFCVEGIEGTKVNLGGSLYSTKPDSFNHLRRILQLFLHPAPNHSKNLSAQ
jgi:CheY-like chemotaxis protein